MASAKSASVRTPQTARAAQTGRSQAARRAALRRVEPSLPQPNQPFFGAHHKYYWLFAVSGFSGLIYESIWTHYLKLFLGHAAYAQSLVLGIFMGGMALGAWLCGRMSQRWRNLLLGYAIVEGVVGVLALAFHPIFVATVDLTLNQLIPHLGSAAQITAAKWSIGALLILPQSVLLGMTFPLMSAGLIRRFPEQPGQRVATLYFANSLGGALGVLGSGFWLIRLLGLPGTVALAGGLNIALALTVAALARASREPEFQSTAPAPAANDAGVSLALLLLVAALTGVSSFMYEIGWIRMLSLVLGSSTHAFELMLFAFILGLALGGLWVRRRIDGIASPTAFLGWVQVLMGASALATLPLYNLSFDAMQALLPMLPKTLAGYTEFNLLSQSIAAVIMLPAALCAGMTLPLITYALLRSGAGERSIGLVYGANTVGAIIGVFFAVHIGMPLLGLKNLIVVGAALDIALGLLLLATCARRIGLRQPAFASVSAVLLLGLCLTLVEFDPYRMVSGVFRGADYRVLSADKAKLLFNRDGKTATISMLETADRVVQVRTNGKADASINLSGSERYQIDEVTMVLSAALPMLLKPDARTVANVGMGSGLTTQVLLANPALQRVDTIEIEEQMVAAARGFWPRNRLAFEDPRSVITIEDAKTFFSNRQQRFDIIVSEPSNPWVSGVSSLFSREFHQLARGYLKPDGVMLQWLQLYEIDEPLVMSVIKSLDENFDDYAIYGANAGDILIVASAGKQLPQLPLALPATPQLAAELKHVGIASPQDIAVRRLATKKSLAPLLKTYAIGINSDYHPVLDQNASAARFIGQGANSLMNLAVEPLPLVEMLSGDHAPWTQTAVSANGHLARMHPGSVAGFLRDHLLGVQSTGFSPEQHATLARQVNDMLAHCARPSDGDAAFALMRIGGLLAPFLQPQELQALWPKVEALPCAQALAGAQRDWLVLLKAVGQRDALVMAQTSSRLFANHEDKTGLRRRYLLSAGMLGYIAAGRPMQAHALWDAQASMALENMAPSLMLRILAAHAGVPL